MTHSSTFNIVYHSIIVYHSLFLFVVFWWLQTIPFFFPGECELNRVSYKCAVDGGYQTFLAKSTASFISWNCQDQWLWTEVYCRMQGLECFTKVSPTPLVIDMNTLDSTSSYMPKNSFLSVCIHAYYRSLTQRRSFCIRESKIKSSDQHSLSPMVPPLELHNNYETCWRAIIQSIVCYALLTEWLWIHVGQRGSKSWDKISGYDSHWNGIIIILAGVWYCKAAIGLLTQECRPCVVIRKVWGSWILQGAHKYLVKVWTWMTICSWFVLPLSNHWKDQDHQPEINNYYSIITVTDLELIYQCSHAGMIFITIIIQEDQVTT